jgi:phage baseplate assembly protein W
MGMEEQKEEKTEEEKKELGKKKRTVAWMHHVIGEVEQFLRKYEARICVEKGMYFDTDECGKIRVRLTIGFD